MSKNCRLQIVDCRLFPGDRAQRVIAMRSRGQANDSQSAICNPKSKMVIGLIGGIGSGKSSAAAALAKQGARLISGDVLGHEALQDAEIKRQVIKRWGNRLVDRQGEI